VTRTGQAAIDAANAHVGIDMAAAGYCLQFTRECFEVGSYYYSAADAWAGARVRHPGDRNPPPAVPVFFATSSPYDHVCIRTEGATCVSTFNEEVRKFADIADIERQFGGTYLGWSEDLNGVTVYAATPDEGDDWLSYLSYEEQRRVLQWADQGQIKLDQLRGVADGTKVNTDRLPNMNAIADHTSAQVDNNHNGILSILDILGGLGAPTGRSLLILFMVVVIAAVMGVLVALFLASAAVGVVAGVGVLIGGGLGFLSGYRGAST
jgi:hypothetical protein